MNYINKNIEDSFDKFLLAPNLKEILSAFNQLCDLVDLNPSENSSTFYQTLQNKLKSYWKAQQLFAKLEKKVSQKEYRKQVFTNIKVLVIGSGPCGLRTAIELALLGARVVVIEKRESFSRNNVLHLWPFVIEDLKSLGAKIFFGMFCAGSIDHISIKRLQCILLKVALLFGVQIFVGVTYHSLIEPDCKRNIQVSPEGDNEDKFGMKKKFGWRAKISPHDHILSDYQFNTVVGADGKSNILGFRRKELRCRLAIAITANFINKNTFEEAQVEEISGVAFIFNQQFFKDIYEKTGIDLENIVYYKDETHYFVMTAKKASLLAKGVLKQDLEDPEMLLNNNNIDYLALQKYAEEAANVVTNNKIPNLEFSKNHRAEADVAVFDFTHMFAAESASKIIERNGYLLLQILVGDSLLEPFWPTGSGCALGFLSSLDASWLVRRMGLITNAFVQNKISSYEQKVLILEAIAERESVYLRLSQTTPNNMPPNFHTYTLNPRTRYTQCKMNCFDITQILHLYDTDDLAKKANILKCDFNNSFKTDFKNKSTQLASFNSKLMGINLSLNYESPITGTHINSNSMKREYMLRWFQIRLDRYFDFKQFKVDDLSKSWISGVAFLCLIHLYRPDLIDVSSINNEDKLRNLKTAISLFENDFHVSETLNIFYSFENLDLIPIFKYLEKIYETLRVLNPVRSEIYVHRCNDNRKVKRRYVPKKIIDNQYQFHNLNSSKILCKTNENKFVSNDIEKGIIEMRKNEILKLYNTNNKYQPITRKRISVDTTDTPFSNRLNIKPKEIKSKLGDKSFLKTHERLKTTNSICHFCKNRIFDKNQETFENYSFHKYCFRCEYCNKELSSQQFKLLQNRHDSEGKFYCMRHFEKISNICFIRDKNVSNLRDLLMKEDKKNNKFIKIDKLKSLPEKIKKPRYCLTDYGCLLSKDQSHILPVDKVFNDMAFFQEIDINIIMKKNYFCLRRINDESDEEYNGSLDESNNMIPLLDFVEPLDENQFSWCLSFNKYDLKYALKKCQVIRKNKLIYKKYKSKEESTSDESEINMLVHDVCKTSDDDILDYYPTVTKEHLNEESLNPQNDIPINKFQDVISPIHEFQHENSNSKEILPLKNIETLEINNDKYSVKDQNINIISDQNSIEINKISNIKDDSKALRQLAKLKFCTEPPKPVSINPKEFISEINRKKTVSCYVSCHLQVAEMLPSTEDMFLMISNRFPKLCNLIVHKKSVLSASVLSLDTYGFNLKLQDEFNDRINNLKDKFSMQYECFEDKSTHRNKFNFPQNNLCDILEIKDIDSLSVNTEDSSVTHTEIISENDILSNVVPLKLKFNQKATLDSELDISLGVSSINEIPFDNKCSNNSLDSIESSSLNSSMKSDISASSESDGKISSTDHLICDDVLHTKTDCFVNCENCQKHSFQHKMQNNKSNLLKDQKSLISFSVEPETNLKELPITLKSFSDTVTPPHDIEIDDTQVKCMELNSQFSFIIENSMSLKNSDVSSNFQRVDCINKQLENIEDRLNEFNHKNFHDISFVTDLSDDKSKRDQLYQNSTTFIKESAEEIDKRIIMDFML